MYHSKLIMISVLCPCITTVHLVKPDITSRLHLFNDWIDHNALDNSIGFSSNYYPKIIISQLDGPIRHVLIHKIFLQDLCRCWWKNNCDFVSNAEEVKHW